jgi:HAD superfamily hydrolase (TIGR01549 family)
MISGIHTILFDVDDTLYDRRHAQEMVVEELYRRMDDVRSSCTFDRAREAFLRSDRLVNRLIDSGGLTGDPRLERSRIFLRLLGRQESRAREVTDLYLRLYSHIAPPVRGAREVLEKLSGRYRLGVVSNGFADIQRHKLRELGIERLFACIVLSGELGIRKPDPRIFEKAVLLLHGDPAEFLYVGDNYGHDVVGAADAGMHTCWFNPEGHAPPPGGKQPDFDIRALRDLVPLLLEKGA